MLGQLAHDQRRNPRLDRLGARAGDAVVANLRVGHDDHLAAIRRVSDHFLVAGHARVEHDLGRDGRGGAERFANEDRTIFTRAGRLGGGLIADRSLGNADWRVKL
jgi:hypothetical protein